MTPTAQPHATDRIDPPANTMHRITTAPVAPIPARIRWAVAAGAAAALAAAWWLGDTAPYPYVQRGLLDVPLPLLTADRMDAVLQPRPGERILEIGPGTGPQSLHVAPQIGPEGRLDLLDIQQEMLDHVMCRAERDGLATILHRAALRRFLSRATSSRNSVTSIAAGRRAANSSAYRASPGR
ncbi:class I SAM-dependent methyltransferase [Streptomyces sp. NPDC087843]|uniref:class I SAM-dependent methyltransferase n=1 Tax=Streptomyces sp. NPDC087843 TaxID=3365804 RepID=UPI00381A9B3F